ncbi:hypothetical protein Rhe02_18320 [Rhizocola hellebori]|uniref:PLL-like beta propeller domain-containing protein n=1 Tax=Rhizocola hellebori TaxID=1392758 RepID=A0A8J3Q4Q0_9ACTN|nr:hypothetical protein Rhe02_18320 [Rhizocola hellebori]
MKLVPDEQAGPGGYKKLQAQYGPAELHLPRTELIDVNCSTVALRPLTAFVQMTDLHIVDDQSPMRFECLNQWADDGPPHYKALPTGAAYRPHESMSTQVVDAMCRAIQKVGRGPKTGLPLEFTIVTGDAVDNCQYNETRWFIDLLDGQPITPNSGGVGDESATGGVLGLDPHYWLPSMKFNELHDGLGLDENFRAGFPEVLALPYAARRRFTAHGLRMPWYTAYGNHDALVQGNLPIDWDHLFNARNTAIGGFKISAFPGLPDRFEDVGDILGAIEEGLFPFPPSGRDVTADQQRRLLSRREFVQEHFTTTGSPAGHGFTAGSDRAYYVIPGGPTDLVCHVVLDTTYPVGGPDGWLDDTQFQWLEGVLRANSSQYIDGDPNTVDCRLVSNPGAVDKLIVIHSHHTSKSMGNRLARLRESNAHSGSDLVTLLLRYPNVILWVTGHNHRNEIAPHARRYLRTGGFWEVTTASHIDWPYQSRIFEIGEGSGTVSIFTTMVDIDAPLDWRNGDIYAPETLASLSRELAANDLQQRKDGVGRRPGADTDRNTQLMVPTPFALPSVATARNQDGRLLVYSADSVGGYYRYEWDTEGQTWSGWSNLPNLAPLRDLTAEPNRDGRVELFGLGTDGQVWRSWQNTPNGTWSLWNVFDMYTVEGWTPPAGGLVSIASACNLDGRLDLYAVDRVGKVFLRQKWYPDWPNGGGWSPWYPLDEVPVGSPLSMIAAEANADGRLEVFGVTTAGTVVHRSQITPGGNWSQWGSLGGDRIYAVTAVRHQDNRLQLYGLRQGAVVMCAQTVAGGSWSGWTDSGAAPENFVELAAERNGSGHVELFALGGSGRLFRRAQGSTTWALLGDVGINIVPDVRGAAPAAARWTLEFGGYPSDTFTVPVHEFADAGTVRSQSPYPGTKNRPGTTTVHLGIGLWDGSHH